MLPELESYLDVLESKHVELKDLLTEIGDNPAALNWRPLGEDEFSIFSLAADVALQEDFWVGHVVGEQAEPPGIDMVQEAKGDQIEPLLRLLEAAQETTTQIFNQLTAEQLEGGIRFNGDVLAVRWCLLSSVQRVAENLGQINMLWQWWQQNQESIN